MNKRLAFWDNYKGILIFFVVFAHFLYKFFEVFPNTSVGYVVSFFYTFHMAAFIFCSGYLSNSRNAESKEAIIKLIIFYLVFNTLMGVFLFFYKGTPISFLTPYNSYWYILSLACWRLIAKHLADIKYIVPITIVIALLVGFYPEFKNILSIRRTIAFLPFFMAGYKLSKDKLNHFIESRNKKQIIIGIISILIVSLLTVILLINFNYTKSILLLGHYRNYIDLLYRISLFVIATLFVFFFIVIIPNKKIPLLTKIGKNSLPIYLIHRFFTIIFVGYLGTKTFKNIYFLYAFIATLLVVLIFGSDLFSKLFNKVFSYINDLVFSINTKKHKIFKTVIIILCAVILFYKPCIKLYNFINSPKEEKSVHSEEVMHSSVTESFEKDIKNSITISYVGDLILLKDQVTSAYDEEEDNYLFDDVFQYAKPYLEDADLAVGVFEGPTAGKDKPYSTSNYGDGIKLRLNFPDEFAKSVKDAGIDFVTTANNHLLDNGFDGAYRTLDVLDDLDIKHIGSYKNKEDKLKNKIQYVNVDGVKIAMLSYTQFINNYNAEMISTDHPYLTSILPSESNKNYDKLYAEMEEDFKEAKANSDVVIVFAHMGTQFIHTTNEFQDKWNRIFSDFGADIVLGDHSHATQPIEYINKTLVVNCPGNFANSYTKYDGDATSIVQIYINKENDKTIGANVIPMFTQKVKRNYYRALPIYDIVNDEDLKNQLSVSDIERAAQVQKIVTKSVLGEEIDISHIKKHNYFINKKYYDPNVNYFERAATRYKNKELYKLIEESKSIAFIGDSITEGTKNSMHGWYEPLINGFENKEIINISKGSYTTKLLLKNYSEELENSNSDLYIIAIGVNDIRYRNEKKCSMDSDTYIKNMKKIVKLLKENNPDAKFVLVAPWMSLPNDKISKLNETEKNEMIIKYSNALKKYANDRGYIYIDPNIYLRKFIKLHNPSLYLIDYIHPNSTTGIKLYSEAVLYASK